MPQLRGLNQLPGLRSYHVFAFREVKLDIALLLIVVHCWLGILSKVTSTECFGVNSSDILKMVSVISHNARDHECPYWYVHVEEIIIDGKFDRVAKREVILKKRKSTHNKLPVGKFDGVAKGHRYVQKQWQCLHYHSFGWWRLNAFCSLNFGIWGCGIA